MTDEIKIGSNIRKIRKEEVLTQEKLAELSGLSINFIYRIERSNDQNISVKNLIMIAKALESKHQCKEFNNDCQSFRSGCSRSIRS
ncbi:helix-turn-helix transcriptional regulator [Oenococcus oeni]